jgi:hypothetical protein
MYMQKPLIHAGYKLVLAALLVCGLGSRIVFAEPPKKLEIRVKHVYGDSVYLDAGSSSGISEGQRFGITRSGEQRPEGGPAFIAEVEVESVATTSAAGKILSATQEINPGDIAYLTEENLAQIRRDLSERELKKYAQVASFTDGIPPEQEVRESIPKPPLPEINRFRGRIAADYSGLQIPGSGTTSQFGFMLRLDATRLGGSHWNISGYHRSKIQSRNDPVNQETLTDLINRTYHLSINYDNPGSRWVAGAGRLYVPWASSLSTLDGFYLGRRFGKETVGIFGGTTPDPSSWNYNSNRQLAGAFINFERGSYTATRFSSTSGIAVSRIHWHPDRQFGFFENGIFYKNYLSIFSNVEADLLTNAQGAGKHELTLARSYFTLRLQPHRAVSFDINENYFRNIPSFDLRLVGTGLLDRYLFQGLNGGFRLQLPYRFGLFANTGRSSRTGDQKPSWNYMGGATASDIFKSGIRGEYRYSKFDSSFGRGSYQSLSATRDLGEGLHFEIQAGQQSVNSAFTSQSRARFVNGSMDWNIGAHYFLGFGATVYRGQAQHYNQYFFNLGYRFDNRRRRSE